MTNEFRIRKILWAVDPFDESEEGHASALAAVTSLHERTGADVLPVSILGLTSGFLPNSAIYADPSIVPKARDAAEDSLADLFPDDRPTWLLEPRLLGAAVDSIAEAVDLLLLESRREDVDLVVARSHGRQRMSRLLSGSFAESLVDRASMPVLVLGPHTAPPRPFDHVLFPTDFGERSRAGFRWVIEWAKAIDARVTLFHALSPPEDMGLDFGSGDQLVEFQGERLSFRDVVERQAERQMRRAAAWAERGSNEGIQADFMIDDSGADLEYLLRSIGHRSRCDLIVMESHDHPLRTAWLGSRSRDVLRAAECPVLILPALFLQEWSRPPLPTAAELSPFL